MHTGSANPALTFDDLKTLDLLHRCLENTAKEARAPNAVVKGSISLPAFIKVCEAHKCTPRQTCTLCLFAKLTSVRNCVGHVYQRPSVC